MEEDNACSLQEASHKEDENQQQESDSSNASTTDISFNASNTAEHLLCSELLVCDFIWSLFVAACKSYRFSSILRPFPPGYREGEQKNIIALKNDISKLPRLSASVDFWSSLQSESQDLLSWVVCTSNFRVKLMEKGNAFKTVRELTGHITDTAEPNYIFEVFASDEMEQKFEQLRDGRKIFYAYHGSRFDNFHSILHNGLNTHLNKVSVFGDGTYLSSELSVSLMYSTAGEGWEHSCLGVKLSCVAVCQLIDDPSVKCQIKEGSQAKKRLRAQASKITDQVPEKYYVVQRNDVIRVKYILVYVHESIQPQTSRASSTHSWLRDHKFPLLMLAYILILVAIGLANSKQAINAVTRFVKRIS